MHGVILAGGLNERLWPIGVPAGAKPLPLIGPLLNAMAKHCAQTIVVCSPTNVGAIAEKAGYGRRLVVQPEARGAGDALMRGLEATNGNAVLIACADNVIPEASWKVFTENLNKDFMFGASSGKTPQEVERFARFRDNIFFEGPVREKPKGTSYITWLGPLYVSSAHILARILAKQAPMYDNLGIVPALTEYARIHPASPVFLDNVKDVGTPEEWLRLAGQEATCTDPGYAHGPHGACLGYSTDRT